MMAVAAATNANTAATSVKPATKEEKKKKNAETWKAWFVCGVLFPLHIVLGVLSIPRILYLLFVVRSANTAILLALYLPFYLYPAQLKYPGWKGFEKLWQWFDYDKSCSSYFGEFEIIGEENVNPSQQYFIACHPHGTVVFQRMYWRTKRLNKLFDRPWRMLAASVLFYIPIVREMTLFFGAVHPSKQHCERLLQTGVNIVVYPGGLDEANHSSGNHSDGTVHVRTRTGFIRLAVKYGIEVLPIFTFGELDAVTSVLPLGKSISKYIQKNFRMSTNVFIGRYYSFIPLRVPYYMCIGKPIPVNSGVMGDRSAEEKEITRVHKLYKAEIRRLYEQNRDACGYHDRELVFECESLSKTTTNH